MRPALAAAAVLVLLAGAAMVRARHAEAHMAYADLLAPSPAAAAAPVETALRPALQGDREATFRFLVTR
jgi:hypothetical protein